MKVTVKTIDAQSIQLDVEAEVSPFCEKGHLHYLDFHLANCERAEKDYCGQIGKNCLLKALSMVASCTYESFHSN